MNRYEVHLRWPSDNARNLRRVPMHAEPNGLRLPGHGNAPPPRPQSATFSTSESSLRRRKCPCEGQLALHNDGDGRASRRPGTKVSCSCCERIADFGDKTALLCANLGSQKAVYHPVVLQQVAVTLSISRCLFGQQVGWPIDLDAVPQVRVCDVDLGNDLTTYPHWERSWVKPHSCVQKEPTRTAIYL